MHTQKILTYLSFFLSLVSTQEPTIDSVLLQASQKVFLTNDQSYLSELNSITSKNIKNQLKRIIGGNPVYDINLTEVRLFSDERILEILLLALIGNFTSGASNSAFQQPCRVVLDPMNGLFELQDDRSTTDQILSVFVIILCIVQLKHILDTSQIYKIRP